MTDPKKIAAGLTEAQRRALLTANPHDLGADDYAPFRGRANGLFVIAPGWQRMELTPLGLAVRAHLENQDDTN